MWKIWLEKDPNEPVCEEQSTPKGLWHCYTHYLFHKKCERDDINELVNGPYNASGLTLQEARIQVVEDCARHER
jgi:hypothetical protein